MYIKKIRSKLICGWCEFAVQCLSGINEVIDAFWVFAFPLLYHVKVQQSEKVLTKGSYSPPQKTLLLH